MNEKDNHINDNFSKAVEASNPKLANIIKNLSQEDIDKITSIINDKEATAKILATPQAQEILKKLKK